MGDVFETLGVGRAFTLDMRKVRERFIALSAEAHPDRFTDAMDQADAAERASVINEAFGVISDPMLRGQALIELLTGGVVSKAEAGALPDGFLMEVMEIREGIEEAREEGDAAKLARVKADAEKEFKARLGAMGDLLDKACGGDLEAVKGARLELNALRYVKRMIEGV